MKATRSIVGALFATAALFAGSMPASVAAQQPQGEGTLLTNPHAELVKAYEGTRTCLACHEPEAKAAFGSIHYQWKAPSPNLANAGGRKLGKINSTNDFCTNPSFQWISILTNDQGKVIGNGCSKCHAGLGAKPSETESRAQLENIDCLLCHSSAYKREVVKKEDGSLSWMPAARGNPGLMLDIAQNVGKPTNLNCLQCHVSSGGGVNFKRGDLESAHLNATRDFDVHVGSGVQCITCHKFRDHKVTGAGTQVSGHERAPSENLSCESSCHTGTPHKTAMLNRHVAAVACTTCHIPSFARKDPTDMRRDWSKAEPVAGQGKYEPHITFATNVKPVYAWWNGLGEVALLDQPVAAGANGRVPMYRPLGAIHEAAAKIHPFKHHTARIPIEAATGFMVPVQVGPTFRTGNTMASALGGAKAFLGKELKAADIAYVEVERYLGLFHEVQPKAKALACNDCHSDNGRLDWKALGYRGDPRKAGSRKVTTAAVNP